MSSKEFVVIGDRVLLKLDDEEKRTEVGLYLPQSVKEKEDVAAGTIIQTGPGSPLVDPLSMTEAPWSKNNEVSLRYIPMEAKPGDYALFLRKSAIEVHIEGENHLILPQSAILLIVREEGEKDLQYD